MNETPNPESHRKCDTRSRGLTMTSRGLARFVAMCAGMTSKWGCGGGLKAVIQYRLNSPLRLASGVDANAGMTLNSYRKRTLFGDFGAQRPTNGDQK